MNTFETTSDLYDLLQQLTSDRNPSSTTRDTLLGYLNQAHIEIVNGGGLLNAASSGSQQTAARQWSWLTPTDEIVSIEPFETGNITVTNGSTAATLDSSPADSKANWFLLFDNSIYKIAAHTAATANVTLDSECASDTGSYAYKLYKLTYTLATADVLRLLDDPFRVSPSPKQIGVISEDGITDSWLFSTPKQQLVEQIAFDVNTDDTAQITVSTISDRTQRLRLRLVTVPAELDLISSDPILPKRHRKMIAHLAAFYHLQKRDDARAQGELQIARMLFGHLVSEEERKLGQQGKYQFAKARLLRASTLTGSRFARLFRGKW